MELRLLKRPVAGLHRQRRSLGLGAVAAVAVIAACSTAARAQEVDPRLEALRPLLGKTWQGALASPDGGRSSAVGWTFEPVAGARGVRLVKTSREPEGRGEGFIYWDGVTRSLRLFFIESSGVVLEGIVTVEANVITLQGTMTWPDPPPNPAATQRYEFRNTFEVLSDTAMRDSWFQNAFGPWRPGHVIEFEAVSGGG